MKYHELTTTSKKSRKRVGRGISAGGGKTAGRGTKGQKARAGSGRRPGFEGGQTPLMMRLPKLRGFRTIRTKAEVVFTGQLDSTGSIITNTTLAENGIISSPNVSVKVLSKGEVTKKHSIRLQHISGTALEQVQKAGGSFVKVERQPRIKKTSSKAE